MCPNNSKDEMERNEGMIVSKEKKIQKQKIQDIQNLFVEKLKVKISETKKM